MKLVRNIPHFYSINGSLRKRETTQPQQNTEYYLFNSQSNLKAYSDDVMSFAYYGYNATNTRTYKLSLYNTNLWINGQQQPLNLQWQNAMFYPNTYLNFDAFGNYTKHYYNGMERIASRLGDNTTTISLNNNILEDRKLQVEDRFREDIQTLISEPTQVDMPPMLDILNLQPTGTPNDIYYYHPNHLGSTSFVTDQNQNITQGFLYAPFGEITTEYNVNFGNNVIPKYAFNAKELDEETGMYYYEARYYAPPAFTSRDPLFEKYFWMSPYAYCANNPVKYVDPSGEDIVIVGDEEYQTKVKNYLDKLYASGKAGRFLVNKAIKSKRTFVIANTKEDVRMELSENQNATILPFNLSKASGTYNEDNGNVDYNPLTILAHELAHFNFPQKGFLLNDKGENSLVRAGEVLAVEWENRVRKDLKMKERISYGGLFVHGKEIIESSKYKGYYNMQNKSNYGDNRDYSVPNYGKYSCQIEKRQTYYINGKYYDSFLLRPLPNKQLRIKF